MPVPEGLTGREKHWNELDDTQKMERMRLVVRNQKRELAELHTMIYRYSRHQHKDDGTLIIAINDIQNRIHPHEDIEAVNNGSVYL